MQGEWKPPLVAEVDWRKPAVCRSPDFLRRYDVNGPDAQYEPPAAPDTFAPLPTGPGGSARSPRYMPVEGRPCPTQRLGPYKPAHRPSVPSVVPIREQFPTAVYVPPINLRARGRC